MPFLLTTTIMSCYFVGIDMKMVLCMEHCLSMIYDSSYINGILNEDNSKVLFSNRNNYLDYKNKL